MKKSSHLKLSLSFISLFVAANIQAQYLDLNKFTYRDYLDFGQNRGKFTPRQDPLTYQGKGDISQKFEKIPDFSHRSRMGATTSVGRNYVVTAHHVVVSAFNQKDQATPGVFKEPNSYLTMMQTWGLSQYDFGINDKNRPRDYKEYGIDTGYFRTSKYIIEGSISPALIGKTIDEEKHVKFFKELNKKCDAMPNNNEQDRLAKVKCWDDVSAQKKEYTTQSVKTLEDYYKGFNEAYQAGRGTLFLVKDGFVPQQGQTALSNVLFGLSGGVWKVLPNGISSNRGLMSFDVFDFKTNGGVREGFTFNPFIGTSEKSAVDFYADVRQGDSGSGFVGWDEKNQQWVLLGVTSFAGTTGDPRISIVTQEQLDDFKKPHEHYFNKNASQNELQKDKDNIFFTEQKLTLNEDLKLAVGGLVFTAGDNVVEGNNHNINDIAGIDVVKGATVTLNNVKLDKDNALHKVGEGKLIINGQTEGNLRFGQGSVQLNDENAFNKIYVTGNNATVILNKAQQVQDKIFFGDGGGRLDLNGQNQEVKNFSVNNNRTKIQNSNAQTSTLTFNNSGDQNLVHAAIGGFIDGKLSKMNITSTNKNTIFDGGFHIDGTVTVSANNEMNLQGHPTLHAYLKGADGKQDFTEVIAQNPGFVPPKKPDNPCMPEAGTNSLKHYYENDVQRQKACLNYLSLKLDGIDLSRPNQLSQEDWDLREYTAKNINLEKGSILNLGKNSVTNANIQLTDATLNIGGQLKHYIDKFDGENTHKNGYDFQQKVESQEMDAGFVVLNGNINQVGGKINASHAGLMINDFAMDNGVFIAKNNTQAMIGKLNMKNHSRLETDNSTLLNIEALNINVKDNNTFSANMNIGGVLSVTEVGKPNLQNTEEDFIALKNDKTLSFSKQAAINVSFSDFVKTHPQDIKLDTVYKLIVSDNLYDQREVRKINFDSLLEHGIESYNKTENNAIYVIFKRKGEPAPEIIDPPQPAPPAPQPPVDQPDPTLPPKPEDNPEVKPNPSKPTPQPEVKPNEPSKPVEIRYAQQYAGIYKAFDNRGVDKLPLNIDYKNEFDKAIFAFQAGEANSEAKLNKVLNVANSYLEDFASVPSTIAPQVQSQNYTKASHRFANNQGQNGWVDLSGMLTKSSYQDLSLAGITVGYDENIDLLLGDNLLLGGFFSYQTGESSQHTYNDDVKALSAGLYGNYHYHNHHDIGGLINVIYEDHKTQYQAGNLLQHNQVSTFKSKAIGLNTHYKYRLFNEDKGDFVHSLKPMVVVGLGYGQFDGFTTEMFKQKDAKGYYASVGAGIEYYIQRENLRYQLNALVKKEFNHYNDKEISFINVDHYMPYHANIVDPVVLDLDLATIIQFTKQTSAQLSLGGFMGTHNTRGLKGNVQFNMAF